MNLYSVYILLNLSVCIPAAIAFARFKYIPRTLIPFCVLLWFAMANELVSLVIIENGGSNAMNGNFFILAEFLFLGSQFYRWGVFNITKYKAGAVIGVALWVTDNFILHQLSANNSLCRIIFAFLYVFLSMDMVNRHMVLGKGRLYFMHTLLLVIGLLLFFACKSFVEVFNAFDMGLTVGFYAHIWFTLSVVNAATNILYAIALLCIQRKPEFSLLSS